MVRVKYSACDLTLVISKDYNDTLDKCPACGSTKDYTILAYAGEEEIDE